MDTGYDCVLLAAGESTRMGRWKLGLPFRGSTVLERSTRNAAVHCRRVIVVTGYRADDAESMVRGIPNVITVRNRTWQRGMFSSIRTGVELVESRKFYIALGDMPLLPPEIYLSLAEAPTHAAVRPVYGRRMGHPVLLDRSVIERIRSSDDSATMKELLRDVSVLEIPAASEYVALDIDTPSDYERLSDPSDG